jgi:hypothetical protein
MNKNKQQVSDRFMESVKAYLDERAANDELFAAAYAKPTKNLTECCNYILGEVEKSGKIHNIVEEENTIYEVDGRIDRYSDKEFYS